PLCQAEYNQIRNNIAEWFAYERLTNREDVLSRMQASELTVIVTKAGTYGYDQASNVLTLQIVAQVNDETERKKFFVSVGLQWSCPITTTCSLCSQSGQQTCTVRDCNGRVVNTYTQFCTPPPPPDVCRGYRDSYSCNNQNACSWDYGNNECYTRSGQ